MKSSVFKSFRFEVVLYSLLSLLYALLSLAVINVGIYLIFQKDLWGLTGGILASAFTISVGVALFILYFLLLTRK
ncbi:MAG: hypothetical protein PHC56_02215, partial [Herbinix sp.]|nr:hypothetical protein [Herbinix sp.]